ncbi:MAG: NAD(P)H-hydrate dehydratase [Gallionella sp.]|nr:NAD(P)H-hydrate dehydratase [Gallionella sp.]
MTLTSRAIQLITQKQLAASLLRRQKDSHKGMFGTVTVIGGASGMTGAALLAARAALKLGAGCVHAVLLAEDAPVADLLQPELMLHKASDLPDFHPHPDGPLASLSPSKREGTNVKSLFNSDVLVIGCGMGRDMSAQKLLRDSLQSPATLVLDADALNLAAAHPDLHEQLVARQGPTVLTPHPGEAARLLACHTADIQAERVACALRLAQKFSCSVVLKGANSLCVTRDGQLFVNDTGNPGMSAPGMGDVLAGMIAAFIAQGLSADDAMLLAVHLHGAAGDELAEHTALGMTATEVTNQARELLNRWISR